MKLRHIAMAVGCSLLLAGCLPVTSKTPVGTTAGLGADEALYGTWIGRAQDQPDQDKNSKDKSTLYFHFIPATPQGESPAIIGAWAVTGSADNNGKLNLYKLRTAKLGDNNFIDVLKFSDGRVGLDAESATQNGLNGGSAPVLYKFGKHHTLTLYLLDEDKVGAAIAAGKLAGTIEKEKYGDTVITSDAAALDAFFATPEAAKLFKVFVVLHKAE
jgi:hypothetical protein